MSDAEPWEVYVRGLSANDKEKMLLVLLQRQVELGMDSEISYREFIPAMFDGDNDCEECIYWSGSGENILNGVS